MDIIGSPSTVTLTTKFGAHPQALQPGQVVDALVLRLIDATRAQLSIANLVLEVQTQVPLVPGTTVKLAVRGTPDNLKLQLLPTPPLQSGAAKSGTVATTSSDVLGGRATAPSPAAADGLATSQAPRQLASAPTAIPAAAALSEAVRSAASTQNGLAPLFADVSAVANAKGLPDSVRQAADQLLALRPPVEHGVAAKDVQQAFSRSGLFFESNLAAVTAGVPAVPVNDLKAALIVMRQVLSTWLGKADPVDAAAEKKPDLKSLPAMSGKTDAAPLRGEAAERQGTAKPSVPAGPSSIYRAAAAAVQAGTPPLVRGPSITPSAVAQQIADLAGKFGAQSPDAGEIASGLAGTAPASIAQSAESPPAVLPSRADLPVAPGRMSPPPPYRGAPPSPQPAAVASISPDGSPRDIGRVLLTETDAALARTTLLQAASVPDQNDQMLQRADPSGPRWHFEIPFAMPQGQTAIAQFEISRDGQGNAAAERTSPAWRARFSLDVEPIGPVHAQIALTGTRAAVTLWAERPDSAARLREASYSLGDALRKADLENEVLVRDGAPPRPREKASPAGRFLDRAS